MKYFGMLPYTTYISSSEKQQWTPTIQASQRLYTTGTLYFANI
jgi:hypothetical protein